jgi:hypothetical protein
MREQSINADLWVARAVGFQITRSPDLPIGSLFGEILGVHVAGFTAGRAVVHAVFAEADLEQALANTAVAGALAAPLRLFAD